MDLRDLKLFLHLAESCHFGRTARAMHVSPSTLSRQIQRLEEDVGHALFLRDNRTVTLTALCIASGLGIFATYNWGRVTDHVGRRPIYLIGTTIMVVFAVPMSCLRISPMFDGANSCTRLPLTRCAPGNQRP